MATERMTPLSEVELSAPDLLIAQARRGEGGTIEKPGCEITLMVSDATVIAGGEILEGPIDPQTAGALKERLSLRSLLAIRDSARG